MKKIIDALDIIPLVEGMNRVLYPEAAGQIDPGVTFVDRHRGRGGFTTSGGSWDAKEGAWFPEGDSSPPRGCDEFLPVMDYRQSFFLRPDGLRAIWWREGGTLLLARRVKGGWEVSLDPQGEEPFAPFRALFDAL